MVGNFPVSKKFSKVWKFFRVPRNFSGCPETFQKISIFCHIFLRSHAKNIRITKNFHQAMLVGISDSVFSPPLPGQSWGWSPFVASSGRHLASNQCRLALLRIYLDFCILINRYSDTLCNVVCQMAKDYVWHFHFFKLSPKKKSLSIVKPVKKTVRSPERYLVFSSPD